jgi:hypothetical protein
MNALALAKTMHNPKRRVLKKRVPNLTALAEMREGVFPSEDKLQNEVVKRLRPLEDALGFRVIAIPNGGKRRPREAQQMKNRGLRAGFPDLMILAGTDIKRCTPTILIELKQPNGSLSDEQVEWHAWLGNMMFPVHVCTSVASVFTVLRSHGIQV